MECESGSQKESARRGWISDDAEITDLVEDYVRVGEVPDNVSEEVMKLRDAGKHQAALELILTYVS